MSEDHQDGRRSDRREQKELRPETVLDSVFRKDGPMPPAGFGLRSLAFGLDFILLTLLSAFIIWQLVLPRSNPGIREELTAYTEEVIAWLGSENPDQQTAPRPSHNLSQAITFASEMQMLIFWIYFASGEAFFGGSSLGKRFCRIRSVSTITLGPLPVFAGIVRGGLKTLCLFFFFPLALIATLLALLFNKRKQLGHDLLSRSAVVDERSMQVRQPTSSPD